MRCPNIGHGNSGKTTVVFYHGVSMTFFNKAMGQGDKEYTHFIVAASTSLRVALLGCATHEQCMVALRMGAGEINELVRC
ncbi:hypothetical protein AN958_12239 [Leucoagaricus sp. SymC.cos]|nr:hypothetical protein AN958_12239 [Leucoagaricus sp. SymC.cos]